MSVPSESPPPSTQGPKKASEKAFAVRIFMLSVCFVVMLVGFEGGSAMLMKPKVDVRRLNVDITQNTVKATVEGTSELSVGLRSHITVHAYTCDFSDGCGTTLQASWNNEESSTVFSSDIVLASSNWTCTRDILVNGAKELAASCSVAGALELFGVLSFPVTRTFQKNVWDVVPRNKDASTQGVPDVSKGSPQAPVQEAVVCPPVEGDLREESIEMKVCIDASHWVRVPQHLEFSLTAPATSFVVQLPRVNASWLVHTSAIKVNKPAGTKAMPVNAAALSKFTSALASPAVGTLADVMLHQDALFVIKPATDDLLGKSIVRQQGSSLKVSMSDASGESQTLLCVNTSDADAFIHKLNACHDVTSLADKGRRLNQNWQQLQFSQGWSSLETAFKDVAQVQTLLMNTRVVVEKAFNSFENKATAVAVVAYLGSRFGGMAKIGESLSTQTDPFEGAQVSHTGTASTFQWTIYKPVLDDLIAIQFSGVPQLKESTWFKQVYEEKHAFSGSVKVHKTLADLVQVPAILRESGSKDNGVKADVSVSVGGAASGEGNVVVKSGSVEIFKVEWSVVAKDGGAKDAIGFGTGTHIVGSSKISLFGASPLTIKADMRNANFPLLSPQFRAYVKQMSFTDSGNSLMKFEKFGSEVLLDCEKPHWMCEFENCRNCRKIPFARSMQSSADPTTITFDLAKTEAAQLLSTYGKAQTSGATTPPKVESGATTPTPPTVEPAVKLTMVVTVKALDYDKVDKNATVKAKLIEDIKDSFIAKVSTAYTKDQLTVTLSKGSVKATVEIQTKPGQDSKTLKSTLKTQSAAVSGSVLSKVKLLPDVAKLLETGKTLGDLTVSVADPEIVAGQVASSTGTPKVASSASAVSAAAIGALLCMGLP